MCSQELGVGGSLAHGGQVQVPFQVDEMFTRYLSNEASGFSIYSGQDQHTTYAFDREGFRYRKEDPADPCHALPDSDVATDPVPGLDDNTVFVDTFSVDFTEILRFP